MNRIAAAVIAGGRGTRMGDPNKALITLRSGTTVLARVRAECVAAGLSPVFLVANDPVAFQSQGLEAVTDRRVNCGPLAGIEAALAATVERGWADGVLIIAGDMPVISQQVLLRMAEEWRITGGCCVAWSRSPEPRSHPLCAVIACSLLPVITAALDAEDRAVHHMWERLAAHKVWFPNADPFLDLDTPEDVAAWRSGEDQLPRRDQKDEGQQSPEHG